MVDRDNQEGAEEETEDFQAASLLHLEEELYRGGSSSQGDVSSGRLLDPWSTEELGLGAGGQDELGSQVGDTGLLNADLDDADEFYRSFINSNSSSPPPQRPNQSRGGGGSQQGGLMADPFDFLNPKAQQPPQQQQRRSRPIPPYMNAPSYGMPPYPWMGPTNPLWMGMGHHPQGGAHDMGQYQTGSSSSFDQGSEDFVDDMTFDVGNISGVGEGGIDDGSLSSLLMVGEAEDSRGSMTDPFPLKRNIKQDGGGRSGGQGYMSSPGLPFGGGMMPGYSYPYAPYGMGPPPQGGYYPPPGPSHHPGGGSGGPGTPGYMPMHFPPGLPGMGMHPGYMQAAYEPAPSGRFIKNEFDKNSGNK